MNVYIFTHKLNISSIYRQLMKNIRGYIQISGLQSSQGIYNKNHELEFLIILYNTELDCNL